MAARVTWLPVGHIAHGYRRVFIVDEDGAVRHVVVVTPMPYEAVYGVRQISGHTPAQDPSLWWGLSIVAGLVADGTLLSPENPDIADDGYIQVRPRAPIKEELLALSSVEAAIRAGEFVLAVERG